MIKTTLKALQESQPCITMLLNARLPVKAAYAVSKLGRAINAELEQFGKTREKLFEEAGCTVTGEGDKKEWTHKEKETLKSVIKQVEELLTTEVEVNALPLDLDQFGSAELPGASFLTLGWALKDA
jgi:hypothetical protein